jgi:hypothetical protein
VTCNPFWLDDKATELSIMYSFFPLVFSLIYLAFRKTKLGYDHGVRDLAREAAGYMLESEEIEKSPHVRDWTFFNFHVFLFLASVYLGMSLTNWGAPNLGGGESLHGAVESIWVKIAGAWIVAGIYIASLLAPRWIQPKPYTEMATSLSL